MDFSTGTNAIVSGLPASVATTITSLSPVVILVGGLILAVFVLGVVLSFLPKRTNTRTHTYAHVDPITGNMVADEDQELGKMEYDIQTKGYWIK